MFLWYAFSVCMCRGYIWQRAETLVWPKHVYDSIKPEVLSIVKFRWSKQKNSQIHEILTFSSKYWSKSNETFIFQNSEIYLVWHSIAYISQTLCFVDFVKNNVLSMPKLKLPWRHHQGNIFRLWTTLCRASGALVVLTLWNWMNVALSLTSKTERFD